MKETLKRDIKSTCQILTWNVRGIMSSAGSLGYLLDKYNIDIACISEHKLKPYYSSFLSSIHSGFVSYTNCETMGNDYTCGKGGVSILIKKSLSFSVDLIDTDSNSRIVGIKTYQTTTKNTYKR